MVKKSKHLVTQEIENGIAVISLASESVVCLPTQDVNDEYIRSLDELELNRLFQSGILVADDFDEAKAFAENFRNWQYHDKAIDITFAPSFACNFNCPYCFESRTSEKPRSEFSANTIRFIKGRINAFNSNGIIFNFFGGEPLIYPKNFRDVYHSILEEFPDLRVSARMTTNGSLLKKNLDVITKDIPLERIQVTLDGPRKYHDNTRCYTSGKPSFDDILEGINYSLDKVEHIEIRVNFDQRNINKLEELLEELATEGLDNVPNLTVYPYPIVDFTPESKSYSSYCISENTFFDVIWKSIDLIASMGFAGVGEYKRRFLKSAIMPKLCGAHTLPFYVIGPKGDIGKCWEFIGRDELSVGNIFDEEQIDREKEQFWLDAGSQKVEGCKDCALLPSCAGGCAAKSLSAKGSIVPSCCHRTRGFIEQNLDKYISLVQKHC